ncbi:MAG: PEP-CTERM sorting domain-containing protein [Myxococcota bacterium]|nr:PEP-CTERM sorting domain-containing protein [Myxococcales bacterium]
MRKRSERCDRISTMAGVAAALLLALPAAASPLFEADVFDFESGWHRPERSGARIEAGADCVVLEASPNARANVLFSRSFLEPDIARARIDALSERGRLTLVAIRYDAEGHKLGRVRLGGDGDGWVDLRGLDWAGTDHVRLKLKLSPDARVDVRRLELHAPAAPEPSAALLMGLGMTVAAARLRRGRRA